MSAVKIKKLCKVYDLKGKTFEALKNVDLSIEEGSFVTIVGKSGCGKTTLLRILAGLEDKSSGEVNFGWGSDPQENSGMGSDPQRAPKISIMFQEPRLMPWLTVKQNMGFSMIDDKDKAQVDKIVTKYLDMLGLTEFKDAYPAQISGGMAQRTSIGRTLCYNPELILMDEPLGALDAFNRRKLQNDLIDIFSKNRKTIIFVTHDVEEAIYLGQKVVVMDKGAVIKEIDIHAPYPRKVNSEYFFNLREEILALILNE